VEARRYVVGKVVQALLTLGFVLTFNFVLFRVMPGNPATLLLRGT
jgi:peptide/nickel transport system permease protein